MRRMITAKRENIDCYDDENIAHNLLKAATEFFLDIGWRLYAVSETGSLVFEGNAARFMSLSENMGGFKEQIGPGTFAELGDVRTLTLAVEALD